MGLRGAELGFTSHQELPELDTTWFKYSHTVMCLLNFTTASAEKLCECIIYSHKNSTENIHDEFFALSNIIINNRSKRYVAIKCEQIKTGYITVSIIVDDCKKVIYECRINRDWAKYAKLQIVWLAANFEVAFGRCQQQNDLIRRENTMEEIFNMTKNGWLCDYLPIAPRSKTTYYNHMILRDASDKQIEYIIRDHHKIMYTYIRQEIRHIPKFIPDVVEIIMQYVMAIDA